MYKCQKIIHKLLILNNFGKVGIFLIKLLENEFELVTLFQSAGVQSVLPHSKPLCGYLKVHTILMQMKVGLLPQRFNCMFVVCLLALLGLGQAELRAELIPAVEHTGSAKLRGMIESEGSVFDRMLSWSEFARVDIPMGAQAGSIVRDIFETLDNPASLTLSLPPIVGTYQGGASNSLDSSSSTSSVPPVFAANLNSCSALSDPVVLLYWRGREFLHIPDAPSSGLFRPPRHFQIDTAI